MYRTLFVLPLFFVGCSEYNYSTNGETISGNEVRQEFLAQGADTDILFFADTSYSMRRELSRMGDEVETFVERLADNQGDWQMLAVTGSDGCGQGGIITPATPDFAQVFAEGIKTEPSDDDVDEGKDEWGLHNAMQAVMASEGGCNDGFIRETGLLHIIMLSDEEDTSPGWDSNDEEYWKQYVDPIIESKGDTNKVRFSAIAGPVPTGCDDGSAEPGYGYFDAVRDSGGEFISICSEDWVDRIDILADTSITQDTFRLKYDAFESSILVWVNGDEREGGWHYDPDLQAVVFTSVLPRGGDEVVIEYVGALEF